MGSTFIERKTKGKAIEICSMFLNMNESNPFLSRIITCYEKWILYDNRKIPAEWIDCGSLLRFFQKTSLHSKKVMITVCWSQAELIHYEFLPASETIIANKYCTQIEEMHKKFTVMCSAKVNRKTKILLRDNARPHIAQQTLEKLNNLKFETLLHPPYSPDLSPTDYHFSKHWIISCLEKYWVTNTVQKRCSRSSSLLVLRTFIRLEFRNLSRVGRSVFNKNETILIK